MERATCEWNLGLQQVLSQGTSFPNFPNFELYISDPQSCPMNPASADVFGCLLERAVVVVAVWVLFFLG